MNAFALFRPSLVTRCRINAVHRGFRQTERVAWSVFPAANALRVPNHRFSTSTLTEEEAEDNNEMNEVKEPPSRIRKWAHRFMVGFGLYVVFGTIFCGFYHYFVVCKYLLSFFRKGI